MLSLLESNRNHLWASSYTQRLATVFSGNQSPIKSLSKAEHDRWNWHIDLPWNRFWMVNASECKWQIVTGGEGFHNIDSWLITPQACCIYDCPIVYNSLHTIHPSHHVTRGCCGRETRPEVPKCTSHLWRCFNPNGAVTYQSSHYILGIFQEP